MPFPVLPPELLRHIFEDALAPPTSSTAVTPAPDAISLTALSHAWRRFTLPRFWATVTISQSADWLWLFGSSTGHLVDKDGRERWSLVQELRLVSGVHPPLRPDLPFEGDLVGGGNIRGGPTTFLVDLEWPVGHRPARISVLPPHTPADDGDARRLWEWHRCHHPSYLDLIARNGADEDGQPTPVTFVATGGGLAESLDNCRQVAYGLMISYIRPLHVRLTVADYETFIAGWVWAAWKAQVRPPYTIFEIGLGPTPRRPASDRWSRGLRIFQTIVAVAADDPDATDLQARSDFAHLARSFATHHSAIPFSHLILRGFGSRFLQEVVLCVDENQIRVRPRKALLAQKVPATLAFVWPDGREGSFDVVSKTWTGSVTP